MRSKVLATLSETFWLLVLGVVVMFAFFAALGAFDVTKAVGVTIAVVALALLWFAAIAPKRSEHETVKASVATEQARLDAAKAQVVAYTASRKQFPGLVEELGELNKAVPSRGAISRLVAQLQRRANARGGELRLIALKEGTAATASTPAQTPPAPGASAVGTDGLATLPFSLQYTGTYFDLLDIIATMRRSVRLRDGDLKINGRLLTVDGLTFKRPEAFQAMTKATINATAYIAPVSAATPQIPAGATTANGGS